MPDHDEVIVGARERVNSGSGVCRRAGGRVFTRQVDSECAMATSLELGDGGPPAPGAVVGAMNEPESGHRTDFATKAEHLSFRAEARGFEPRMGFKTQTALAVRRHRPD